MDSMVLSEFLVPITLNVLTTEAEEFLCHGEASVSTLFLDIVLLSGKAQ